MSEVTKHQSEQRVLLRSEIHPAPYNPRTISDTALANIRRNIKKIGLLGGVVVNLQTMNIVSGHQRVSVLDSLNKYDPETHENDYQLRCDVIDVDEKTEKEQNIFMNNRSVQGEFDTDMLENMLSDIDYANAGLDDFDLQMLGIGEIDESMTNGLSWNEEETAKENNIQHISAISKCGEEDKKTDRSVNFYDDTAENQIKRHNEVQKIKERIADQRTSDGGMLSYVVLSFSSPEVRIRFMAEFGYTEDDKYVDGEEFARKIEFGE